MDNQEMMVQGGYGQMQNPQPMNAGAVAAMSTTREAQEVQAAVFMAKRFPRDENFALARINQSCQRRGLAEKAIYTYPKGGQNVTGPSIRLAEAIAQAWGNIQSGVVELEQNSRYLINPGSVGQPRDLDPRAAYAILDTESRTLTLRRVNYDVEAAAAKISNTGLPTSFATALRKGASPTGD